MLVCILDMWSIQTLVTSALVNSEVIYFLLVNSNIMAGRFRPHGNKVRMDQSLSIVKSEFTKVRVELRSKPTEVWTLMNMLWRRVAGTGLEAVVAVVEVVVVVVIVVVVLVQ